MVESAALEMRYTSNGIQGSNPCLSANERAPRANERREASQLLGSRQGFESRSDVRPRRTARPGRGACFPPSVTRAESLATVTKSLSLRF